MNIRQKKKLFKKNLIKIKKLHPKQGDVICITPDFEAFNLDEIAEFFDIWCKLDVFGKAKTVLTPGNIKSLSEEQYLKILQINKQLKG